jgi:hypothetical protein
MFISASTTTRIYSPLKRTKRRNHPASWWRGIFTYDLDTDTYGTAPADIVSPTRKKRKEMLIVDFGDSFFLDTFIKNRGLREVILSLTLEAKRTAESIGNTRRDLENLKSVVQLILNYC